MNKEKSKRNGWKVILWLTGFARFFVCFAIFKYPLFVVISTLILDDLDCLFAKRAGLNWRQYQLYDKLLDYWWYIFIILYSINLEIFPIIIFLFLIRSLGQFLALKNKKEIYFVIFPNILEIFFVFYVLSFSFSGINTVFQNQYPVYALVISTVITLVREILLHIVKISPESRFKVTATYTKSEKW